MITRGVEYRFLVIDDDKVDLALDRLDRRMRAFTQANEKASGSQRELEREFMRTSTAMERADRQSRRAAAGADQLARSTAGAGEAAVRARTGFVALISALSARALLQMGEEGGQLEVISRRLREIGVTAENTDSIVSRLGGGSTASVEKLISRADAAGLSFENMQRLADAALQVSIKRGEDAGEVFDKLTTSISTGRTAYLKQIGVVVDAQAAQEDYAKSLGKTRAELTEQEKIAASSAATIDELNAAFSGEAPDKYASNISAVRDAFNNLNDSIKRLVAEALNNLGAVISGGLFNASFASDPVRSRLQVIQDEIGELEKLERRFVEAKASSAALLGQEVEAAIDEVGEERFRYLLGLPSDTKLNRFTLAYIDSVGSVRKQIAAAQERETLAIAAEAYNEQIEAEAAPPPRESERDRKKQEAEAERRRRAAQRAAQREAEQQRRDAERLARQQLAFDDQLAQRRVALIRDEGVRQLAEMELAHQEQLRGEVAQGERRNALLELQAQERAALLGRIRADEQRQQRESQEQAIRNLRPKADAGDFDAIAELEQAESDKARSDALGTLDDRLQSGAISQQEAANARMMLASAEADVLQRVAQDSNNALAGLAGELQQNLTGIAEEGSRRRVAAWASEGAAYAASAGALANSAAGLLESVGASERAIAAVKGGAMIALAAEETAKAVAAGAAQNYVGAAQHGLAAIAAGVAAKEHFAVAGGGGKSAPTGSAAGGGRAPSAVDDARIRGEDRDRGPIQQNINVQVGGLPLVDQRGISLAVMRSVDEAGLAPGRRRTNVRRVAI